MQTPVVGIDTNIFIYYFEGHNIFGAQVAPLFLLLESGQLQAVTSVLTHIELLSLPLEQRELESLSGLFLTTPNLLIKPLDTTQSLRAAQLRLEYSFSTPDAIQLTAALSHGSRYFITNDRKLKNCRDLEVVLLAELKTKLAI